MKTTPQELAKFTDDYLKGKDFNQVQMEAMKYCLDKGIIKKESFQKAMEIGRTAQIRQMKIAMMMYMDSLYQPKQ